MSAWCVVAAALVAGYPFARVLSPACGRALRAATRAFVAAPLLLVALSLLFAAG